METWSHWEWLVPLCRFGRNCPKVTRMDIVKVKKGWHYVNTTIDFNEEWDLWVQLVDGFSAFFTQEAPEGSEMWYSLMHLCCILEGSSGEGSRVLAPVPPAGLLSCPAQRLASLMQWRKEVSEGKEVKKEVKRVNATETDWVLLCS